MANDAARGATSSRCCSARRSRAALPASGGAARGCRRGDADRHRRWRAATRCAIRDGAARRASTAWRAHRVVIVGGGVAGLAAAWGLRRARHRRRRRARARRRRSAAPRAAARSAVTPYPWGAHYIVAPQREQTALVALLGEMGAIEGTAADGTPIVAEELRCREPEERVFYRGRWYEGLYLDAGASADDRAQLARVQAEIDGWAAWRDAPGRRAFALPRSHAQPTTPRSPRSIAMSIARVARRARAALAAPALAVDYACRDDYALTAARDQRVGRAVLLRVARSARRAPSASRCVTWPDGNGALVAPPRDAARAIERGVAVVDVDARRRRRVIAVGPRRRRSACAPTRSIVAAPRFVARPHRRAARRGHAARRVRRVGGREPAPARAPVERGRGAPLAWDNVLRDSPSLGYVVATHQRGRDRGADGVDLVLPVHRRGRRARRASSSPAPATPSGPRSCSPISRARTPTCATTSIASTSRSGATA